MTVRTALTALVLAAAFPGSPRPVHPQSAVQLRKQTVNALRLTREARDSMTVINERHRLDLPRDSAQVGAILLRFDADNVTGATRSAAERGATLAWERAQVVFGTDAPAVARRHAVVVYRQDYPSNVRAVFSSPFSSVDFSLGTRWGRSTGTLGMPLSGAHSARAIEDLLGTVAAESLAMPLREWMGNWIRVEPLERDAWESAALDLATSNSATARACYAGSTEQCANALGLTPVHDSLAEWYSQEDWRVLVSRWTPDMRNAEQVAMKRECLEQRVFATCARIVRGRTIPIPLTIWTRQLFVAFALERGGPQAFATLSASHATLTETVASASGMGADALLAAWRERLIASIPHEVRPSALEFSVAMAWTVAFAALAMRRRP